MRLQLLEFQEEYHTDLVKSLYGLLMLLPQSAAFRILRDRLASVSNMAATIPRLENISSSHSNSSGGLSLSNKFSKDNKNKSKMTVDTSSIFVDQLALLRHFDMIVVQKKTII
jgi:vacuole morphology and inheritance protein 14